MPTAAEKQIEQGFLETEFGCKTAEILNASGRSVLRVPVPQLGGAATERLFPGSRAVREAHGFSLHEAGDLLLGCSVVSADGLLLEATHDLYRRMLAASAGRALYRIWNYVPAINAELAGRENYRTFCIGRSRAFEAALGQGFRHALPAASGVGCGGASLAVFFVAGRAAPRHIENPEQVSAYNYPKEHGERPPSFARATVATHAGQSLVFISGTSSIKGHATVAPHSLGGQLECTLDNLRGIGRASGVGRSLGADSRMTRRFRVYLRHAADFQAARARLERDLFQPEDTVVYLRADICRAALDVEIEATLLG
jgi:hypothetical protein